MDEFYIRHNAKMPAIKTFFPKNRENGVVLNCVSTVHGSAHYELTAQELWVFASYERLNLLQTVSLY